MHTLFSRIYKRYEFDSEWQHRLVYAHNSLCLPSYKHIIIHLLVMHVPLSNSFLFFFFFFFFCLIRKIGSVKSLIFSRSRSLKQGLLTSTARCQGDTRVMFPPLKLKHNKRSSFWLQNYLIFKTPIRIVADDILTSFFISVIIWGKNAWYFIRLVSI